MERKSDMVRNLVTNGDYKAALRIAKGFRLGISAEDSKVMSMGYECMVHPEFYKGLGYDVATTVKKGVETVQRLYGV